MDVLRTMVAAWNRRDGGAFASTFAPSATYVTGSGQEFRGRDAISGLVKQATASVKIAGVRVECKAPLGLAEFRWSATRGEGPVRRGVIACVLSREGETWLIQKLANEEHMTPRGRPTRG